MNQLSLEKKPVGVVSPPYSNRLRDEGREHTGGILQREMEKGNIKFVESYRYSTNKDNIGNMMDNLSDNEDLDLTQFTKGELYWHGCYGSFRDWRNYVTPESFAHPAKMSPKLCDMIFKHLKQSGLLQEGMTVIDFMSGIGTTNMMASLHGLDSVGVELEPHFIKMQEANRQKCKDRGISRKWEILQGDSRKLSELVKGKEYAGVISPPYQNIQIGKGLNTKPPRAGTNDQSNRNPNSPSQIATTYTNKALMGVVSPPYSDGQRIGRSYDLNELDKKRGYENVGGFRDRYSSNPSNIGNLPDKKLAGVVSPPYDTAQLTYAKNAILEDGNKPYLRPYMKGTEENYATTNPENLGNQQGENYLSAMLQVYQEAYKSGISPLALVTKNPTRKGKLRRLDIDTVKLLMTTGYEIFDYHRALLFTEHQQATLTGEVKKQVRGRLSFFKRLSMQKGSPVAQWEDVIIAVIPQPAVRT